MWIGFTEHRHSDCPGYLFIYFFIYFLQKVVKESNLCLVGKFAFVTLHKTSQDVCRMGWWDFSRYLWSTRLPKPEKLYKQDFYSCSTCGPSVFILFSFRKFPEKGVGPNTSLFPASATSPASNKEKNSTVGIVVSKLTSSRGSVFTLWVKTNTIFELIYYPSFRNTYLVCED